jgi:hypothetical protein
VSAIRHCVAAGNVREHPGLSGPTLFGALPHDGSWQSLWRSPLSIGGSFMANHHEPSTRHLHICGTRRKTRHKAE